MPGRAEAGKKGASGLALQKAWAGWARGGRQAPTGPGQGEGRWGLIHLPSEGMGSEARACLAEDLS